MTLKKPIEGPLIKREPTHVTLYEAATATGALCGFRPTLVVMLAESCPTSRCKRSHYLSLSRWLGLRMAICPTHSLDFVRYKLAKRGVAGLASDPAPDAVHMVEQGTTRESNFSALIATPRLTRQRLSRLEQ